MVWPALAVVARGPPGSRFFGEFRGKLFLLAFVASHCSEGYGRALVAAAKASSPAPCFGSGFLVKRTQVVRFAVAARD